MSAKAPCGFCDIHPAISAAVAYTGPDTGGKKRRMCRECWATFQHKGKKTNSKED